MLWRSSREYHCTQAATSLKSPNALTCCSLNPATLARPRPTHACRPTLPAVFCPTWVFSFSPFCGPTLQHAGSRSQSLSFPNLSGRILLPVLLSGSVADWLRRANARVFICRCAFRLIVMPHSISYPSLRGRWLRKT